LLPKVLILGGSGLLGHKIFQVLRQRSMSVACTIRESLRGSPLEAVGIYRDGDDVVEGLDAMNFEAVERTLTVRRPDVVVNCIGVIKQRPAASLPLPSLTLNALLPHRLAAVAERLGTRVIHFSTDCVFSGKKGGYTEDDPSDALDLYGRTKYLGEVVAPNALTLRTSMIGRELATHASLLDWFLSQEHGRVRGFTRHVYSGVTTPHLAEVVADLIERHTNLSGLYQVTCPAISKYDLLCLLRDAFRLHVEITPDEGTVCDRSMVGDRFDRAVNRKPPDWRDLVQQLASDPTPYPRRTQ
jgi:dTDP-4-dehydrorhamnose reductase